MKNKREYIVEWGANGNTSGQFTCTNLKKAKKDGREVAVGNTFPNNSWYLYVLVKVDDKDAESCGFTHIEVYKSKGRLKKSLT